MTSKQYDSEADRIRKILPPGPKVVVIGSGDFWGHDTNKICAGVGERLAAVEELVLITGGITGIGEAVGRSFFMARKEYRLGENVYHILPNGSGTWDYGTTVAGGETMEDRREILGRLAGLYLAIEGGPGTAHEARVALMRGAAIIPIGRTGGFSGEFYPKAACPRPEIASQWQLLGDHKAGIEQVCVAVVQCIQVLLQSVP